MKKAVVVFVLGVLILAFGGCRMARVCNSTGGMEVSQSEGGMAQTSVDDPCFSDWLAVVSAVATRTASGFLVAQVELRNIHQDVDDDGREDDFAAQYQIQWFDANGMAVQPDRSVWQRVNWHGGEVMPIKATAPAPEVVRYLLRLRHVR